MRKLGYRTKKILVTTAAALAIGSTCGLSTIRGCKGMDTNHETYLSIRHSILSNKLNPDCLTSREKLVNELEPILGRDAAVRFSLDIQPFVDDYKRESSVAKNGDQLGEATRKLASGVHQRLMVEAINTQTDGQRADFWWTGMTMFAMGEPSNDGANGVAYGAKVRRCVKAIKRACSD